MKMTLSRKQEPCNTQKSINKIRTHKSGAKTMLLVAMNRKQSVDSREFDILMHHKHETLLAVELDKKDLCYNISGMTPLSTVFARPMSADSFFEILEELVDMLKLTQDAYLQPNNVLIDLEHIFVEPRSGKLRFVYLPIIDYANKTDFLLFFRGLVGMVSLMREADQKPVEKLLGYLNSTVLFSVHDMERFVRNSKKPPEGNIWEAGVINAMKDSQSLQVCRCCKTTNNGSARYCANCGQRLAEDNNDRFYSPKASEHRAAAQPPRSAPIQQPPQVQQPVQSWQPPQVQQPVQSWQPPQVQQPVQSWQPPQVQQPAQVWQVPQLQQPQQVPVYATLFHVRSGAQVQLRKARFVLGKDPSVVDYIVVGNSAVSRIHAEVLSSDGHYYVKDLRSTNGTHVNGQRLPAETPYEIFSEQRITLADEEFIFRCKQADLQPHVAAGGTTVL